MLGLSSWREFKFRCQAEPSSLLHVETRKHCVFARIRISRISLDIQLQERILVLLSRNKTDLNARNVHSAKKELRSFTGTLKSASGLFMAASEHRWHFWTHNVCIAWRMISTFLSPECYLVVFSSGLWREKDRMSVTNGISTFDTGRIHQKGRVWAWMEAILACNTELQQFVWDALVLKFAEDYILKGVFGLEATQSGKRSRDTMSCV